MEFPGQGSEQSYSCKLRCPCGNAGSDPLTHSARQGIEPASWCSRHASDPIVPQQALSLKLVLIDARGDGVAGAREDESGQVNGASSRSIFFPRCWPGGCGWVGSGLKAFIWGSLLCSSFTYIFYCLGSKSSLWRSMVIFI